MKKSIHAAIAALALASVLSVFAVAEDAPKSAEKSSKVYSVQCGSPCSFAVSGHDKDEVIAVVIEHAKTHHNLVLTAKDVEGMMKTTDSAG